MGYRTLIRRYIQHVELAVGDNFIESVVPESELTPRDLGELRTLAAEIRRNEHAARPSTTRNPNQRLRLLMSRYALDNDELASISGSCEEQIRAWRASPRSPNYEPMNDDQLQVLERAIEGWLEKLGQH